MSETAEKTTATDAKRGPNLDTSERSKKLTISRVCGKQAPMQDGEPTRWLADFYCYVTGNKTEESEFGEYNRWLGEFRSVNCQTGEVLKAANAIFPSIASDVIEAAYIGANKAGDTSGQGGNVMLAFRLGLVPDWYTAEGGVRMPANKSGYKYTMKDIVAPSHRSPLDMLYAEVHAPLLENQTPTPSQIEDKSDEAEAAKSVGNRSGRRAAA